MRVDPSIVGMNDLVDIPVVDKVLKGHQDGTAISFQGLSVKLNKSLSRDDLQRVLNKFEKRLKKLELIVNTETEFKIDEDTGMIIVKIKDKDSGEIIRQIPSEVVVKLAKTIDEFLGVLFDKRV